jgi:hypothetical protein
MTLLTIDTPEGIRAWVWTSRMYQLAFEINTGMSAPGTHGRSILKAMHTEGFLEKPLTGTKANKLLVLRAMVDAMKEANPEYEPQSTVIRALRETD